MINVKSTIQIQSSNKQNSKKYDLEKRTTEFAKNVVIFCRIEPQSQTAKPIIDQLIRSATSIGANYREANGADSKTDFRSKISICKKEAKETMYWLELLSQLSLRKTILRTLWSECHELTLIFASITRRLYR